MHLCAALSLLCVLCKSVLQKIKSLVTSDFNHKSCPARARTWTFLNQNQACCQLHHGTVNFKKRSANLIFVLNTPKHLF